MPISVSCQDCGKPLKAPDSLAGKRAKCPECGAVVPIPEADVELEAINEPPKLDAEVDHKEDAPAVDRKPCPMCGEMIAAVALKCRFCGELFDSKETVEGRQSRPFRGYAGFLIRVVASFIDFIPVFILSAIVGSVLGTREAGNLVFLLTGWLYYALQESSAKQATLGKRLMHICVTDLDGRQVSFGRASGRHFGKILSGMILLIGFLMAAFTEKKQTLHDMLAGTLVVRDYHP